MRISDWSSDVCSSDLAVAIGLVLQYPDPRDANVRMPRRDHFVEHRGRERSRVGRHARCRHESRQRNFRHFPLLSFEPALHPASWPANTRNMLGQQIIPPSTMISAPETSLASSDAINTTTRAKSQPPPNIGKAACRE